MKELQHYVTAYLEDPERRAAWEDATGGTPEQCPPIYSFDNPSIHKDNATHLRELGLVEADGETPTAAWLALPSYSPDLHRTIERTHARVCGEFQQWVDNESTSRSMEVYCTTLARLFYNTQKPSVISRCMNKHKASMHALYKKVIELKGGRAPAPFK